MNEENYRVFRKLWDEHSGTNEDVAKFYFNAGRTYEIELKEQKRNPVFQPKPRDIVGKKGEERFVNHVSEYKTCILVNYDRGGEENHLENCQCTLQEWQAWAKDADLIRRRKK
jgi:hypothetical protein